MLPDQTPAFGRTRSASWLAVVIAALTLTAGCGPEATRPADMAAVVQEWRGRALPANVRDLLLAYAAESSADARRAEAAGVRVRRDTWRGMKAAAGREAVDWAALDGAMAVLLARAGHPEALAGLSAAVAQRDARALRAEIDRRRDVGPILGARTLPLHQGEHEELPQVDGDVSAFFADPEGIVIGPSPEDLKATGVAAVTPEIRAIVGSVGADALREPGMTPVQFVHDGVDLAGRTAASVFARSAARRAFDLELPRPPR